MEKKKKDDVSRKKINSSIQQYTTGHNPVYRYRSGCSSVPGDFTKSSAEEMSNPVEVLSVLSNGLGLLVTNDMQSEHLSSGFRFDLYVKAASDGKSLGDCPFCHYVQMYAKTLGIADDQFCVHYIDTANKPESFMKLNEKGTVPVLVDNQRKQTFTDSMDMAKYLREQFPGKDPLSGYSGPDKAFFGVVLPKLGNLLKNKDGNHDSEKYKSELIAQLQIINDYVDQSSSDRKGNYLAGEHVSELDCVFMPRLRHVAVAGGHYEGVNIGEFPALKEYFDNAMTCNEFTSTCCVEEELIKGWARHRK